MFDATARCTNASFADYKIPGILDMPAGFMANEAVEAEQDERSVRRQGRRAKARTFGVSPAIANAIDDAVGVRLTELPLTPRRFSAHRRALDTAQAGWDE